MAHETREKHENNCRGAVTAPFWQGNIIRKEQELCRIAQ